MLFSLSSNSVICRSVVAASWLPWPSPPSASVTALPRQAVAPLLISSLGAASPLRVDRHVSWSGRPALGDGPWLSLPRLLDGLSPPGLSYVAFRSGQVRTRESESLPGLFCVALLF